MSGELGQRIVLHSRDRGCTKPGCTVSGYDSQVHHIRGWATHHGRTNVDEEVLACGADNRLAEERWTVRIHRGRVEWTPPPELDTGQARVNFYHHPTASSPPTTKTRISRLGLRRRSAAQRTCMGLRRGAGNGGPASSCPSDLELVTLSVSRHRGPSRTYNSQRRMPW